LSQPAPPLIRVPSERERRFRGGDLPEAAAPAGLTPKRDPVWWLLLILAALMLLGSMVRGVSIQVRFSQQPIEAEAVGEPATLDSASRITDQPKTDQR